MKREKGNNKSTQIGGFNFRLRVKTLKIVIFSTKENILGLSYTSHSHTVLPMFRNLKISRDP